MVKESGDTSDRVFDWLGEAILNGEIPFGEKLNEPRLARQFSVSRGPVREAIRRLEEKRLVVRKPNQGARVIVPTDQGLLELFTLREALEGMAAREAAQKITPPEVEALREAVRRGAVAGNDPAATLPDLHILIARASKNSLLFTLLCDDYYKLLALYRRQYAIIFGRRDDTSHEHERIVEAIADHDEDVAEILMRRHIRRARENLLTRI